MATKRKVNKRKYSPKSDHVAWIATMLDEPDRRELLLYAELLLARQAERSIKLDTMTDAVQTSKGIG